MLDTLTDKDLFFLLQKLEPATPKWKTMGLALGFLYDQLTVIEQKPMLIPEGDWLHLWYAKPVVEMGSSQPWPANSEQENLAINLRAKFIQGKGFGIYNVW